MFGAWKKHEYTSWALDTETLAKNDISYTPNRTNRESVGGPGLEWGAWFEFQKETEKLGDVYLPLLVDMFNNSVMLLPSEARGGKLGHVCAFACPFYFLSSLIRLLQMGTDDDPLRRLQVPHLTTWS